MISKWLNGYRKMFVRCKDSSINLVKSLPKTVSQFIKTGLIVIVLGVFVIIMMSEKFDAFFMKQGFSRTIRSLYSIPMVISTAIIVLLSIAQLLIDSKSRLGKVILNCIITIITLFIFIKKVLAKVLGILEQENISKYWPVFTMAMCLGLFLLLTMILIRHRVFLGWDSESYIGMIVVISELISLIFVEISFKFFLNVNLWLKYRGDRDEQSAEKSIIQREFCKTKVYFYIVSVLILLCIKNPHLDQYYSLFIDDFIGIVAVLALVREVRQGTYKKESLNAKNNS